VAQSIKDFDEFAIKQDILDENDNSEEYYDNIIKEKFKPTPRFFGWGLARKLRKSKQRKNKKFLLKLMPNNSVCTEIGVFQGQLSQDILTIVKPKELYLIDPWLHDDEFFNGNYCSPKLFNIEKNEERYQLVKKKFENNPIVSIIREKSEIALEKFPDNFFDWVYIDGDHSTEAVLKDLELCLKKVKPTGYITGDDIRFDENANNTHKAVRKSVIKFLNEAPVELIMIKHNQFILQVRKKN